MKWIVLFLVCLPVLALADTAPETTRINNRCTEYRLCDAKSGTGICTDTANADEQIMHIGLPAEYMFDAVNSTSTNYSCNIFTNRTGFDADNSSDQVNTTAISDEAPVYLMRALFRYLWINCSTNDNNTVTIDVEVCVVE
jgi:hypothetical protein